MAGDILVETDYLPVAHPGHPLFRRGQALSDADLRQVIEITIEAGAAAPGPAGHVRQGGPQRWQVSNHETAEKALAAGIGYGWLPRHQVQEALAAGHLALLPLGSYPRRISRFYLAWLASRPLSEEGRQLASSLRACLRPDPGAQPDDGPGPK
jgi:DNA-binding transcriptional LysR family regulator